MICSRAVSCFEPGEQGGTHVGNALLSAVGNAVVEIVADPDFLAGVRARGEHLASELHALGKPREATVRGLGMLQALCLRAPMAEAVAVDCLNRGLLLNAPHPDVLRFMPALDVSVADIDRMAGILGETLASVRDQ
jgi:acetylornithine/N-succinyldiaminopimelate aminotransferase